MKIFRLLLLAAAVVTGLALLPSRSFAAEPTVENTERHIYSDRCGGRKSVWLRHPSRNQMKVEILR